jgi:hypothetical protein
MEIELLQRIEPGKAGDFLSSKKGIYFWFDKNTDALVYIGIALGTGGLKRRIISQHLNPAYLEFRHEKHTKKDQFQLENAIQRVRKGGNTSQKGIDKSAFRKSIGRKLKLKPGLETASYILENLYLKIFESEITNDVRSLEIELIKKHEPIFNTAHKLRYA